MLLLVVRCQEIASKEFIFKIFLVCHYIAVETPVQACCACWVDMEVDTIKAIGDGNEKHDP
jgi:hypothetical protein